MLSDCPRTQTVELYFWPRLLDRIIVAGQYVQVSSGVLRKSPRWGVSMSHVAHRDSDPNSAPTEWKLLRNESLSDWFRTYIAEDVEGKPSPTIVASES